MTDEKKYEEGLFNFHELARYIILKKSCRLTIYCNSDKCPIYAMCDEREKCNFCNLEQWLKDNPEKSCDNCKEIYCKYRYNSKQSDYSRKYCTEWQPIEKSCKNCKRFKCIDRDISYICPPCSNWQSIEKDKCDCCEGVNYGNNGKKVCLQELSKCKKDIDDWIDLDLDNLPCDILKEGVYDIEYFSQVHPNPMDMEKIKKDTINGVDGYWFKTKELDPRVVHRYRKHKLTLDEMAEKYLMNKVKVLLTKDEEKLFLDAYKQGYKDGEKQ